jgi:hypothetical protein
MCGGESCGILWLISPSEWLLIQMKGLRMAKRLVDLYSEGQAVEIRLKGGGWQAGRIVRSDHPGVWVLMLDGSHWFVTNGRNIRPAPGEPDAPAKTDH